MKFLLLVQFTGLVLLGTTVLCEEKSDTILKEPIKQLTELKEGESETLEDGQETLESLPQDEEEIQESIEDANEPRSFHVVDVPDDENVNLGQILGGFFGGDNDEQKENFNREGRAKRKNNDGLVFSNDTEVISQYNGFIDAFLRQMTLTMKETSDPLTIILRKNFKITGTPKRKGPASLTDEEEGTPSEGPKRPKRPKRNRNKNRTKRKTRHPKDLNLDVAALEDEEEESFLKREKREIAEEGAAELKIETDETEETEETEKMEEITEADNPNVDVELREGKALEEDYEDVDEEEELEEDVALTEEDEKSLAEVNGKALSSTDAEGDEGRSDGNDVESRNRRNRRRRRKGGRKGKRRKGKCAKKCQRKRRRRMRIRRRNRINKNRGKRSVGSAAILSGLSLIRRNGDVQIVQKTNTQDIHANVEVGPVTLSAEKSFGEGDKIEQRRSEAVAPVVKGKLVINISKDGNATVNSFKIFRPKDVSVSGSLRLDQSKDSDRLMQTYLTQSSSFVSKRMKAAANKVFGFGPTKTKNNKNNRNIAGNKKVKRNKPKN